MCFCFHSGMVVRNLLDDWRTPSGRKVSVNPEVASLVINVKKCKCMMQVYDASLMAKQHLGGEQWHQELLTWISISAVLPQCKLYGVVVVPNLWGCRVSEWLCGRVVQWLARDLKVVSSILGHGSFLVREACWVCWDSVRLIAATASDAYKHC